MESLLHTLTGQCLARHDLDAVQVAGAAAALAAPGVDRELKKSFLRALSDKGETPFEVAELARAFRNLAISPGLEAYADRAVDVCGTGGDHSGSFNVSTTVAMLLAAAGVPVFKHGNRSVTSKSGSADFLEACGFNLAPDPVLIHKSIRELNFCFLFAPAFHPAFKEIGPVRRELGAEGRRTVFNLLGPLINPARPAGQLVGVFAGNWVQPLADALGHLGVKRGLVVHSQFPGGAGMDELSCAGVNQLAGFGEFIDFDPILVPHLLGLANCPVSDLAGGDAQENVGRLHQLLAGQGPAGLADTIVLNGAAGFIAAARTQSWIEGIALARETLLGGTLETWLKRTREFYAAG